MDGQECGGRRVRHRQLLEDPHAVQAAQRTAAHVVATVDRCHAELRRLTQFVDREMVGGIPFQGMRSQAFVGECCRRLGDDAFVVVQAE